MVRKAGFHGTTKVNAGGNTAMDDIPSRRGDRINFVLAYAIKNGNQLRHDEPLGSNAEFAYFLYLTFLF